MKSTPYVLLVTLVSLALSGCIAGDPLPQTDGTEDVLLPASLLPEISELEGDVGTSFATPVLSFNTGSTYSFPLTPGANTTGYVLELTWDATRATHDTLDIWIRDASAGAIPPSSPEGAIPVAPAAKATGTSPLRLSVPADQLEDIEYSILVRAGGPVGVVETQPFVLKIAHFADLEFDAEFDFATAAGNTTA